ncbi:hypothetical protein [Fictibacillus enclensis]|uniref:hypothetical protein n=1 Tax=Fictibacillus enclensis TaxID=1017270 RepID=UPI0024C0C17D|nr:hypothetical protein [Fictibacillus enclensis]WHY73444.1 hypothetical protein QNH15_05900 [Fictibacillus enclensis]
MNESIAKLTLERAVNEAQARSILNATMLKLRTQYGYAPDKGVTPDEMTARCEALVEAVCGAVEDYVEATGKAPDRMRNTARYRVSKEFPKKKYEGLQAYANVLDQRLKRAPLHTAEAIGNLLDFNAEYLVKAHELDEIKRRSRKEWQRLEYEYVERSDFNLRELHHRLLEHMDEEVFGDSIAGEYRKERRHWRKCRCYSCDNYFPMAKKHFMAKKRIWKFKSIDTGNKNSRYCSEKCQKAQEKALLRLKSDGTLLPKHFYLSVSDEWASDRYNSHNLPFAPEILSGISDKKSSKSVKKAPPKIQY